MKKDELSESLSQDSNKIDGINKYGKKKKNKSSTCKGVLYYISIISFSFAFIFVVIWGYYLLSEKDKKILNLEKENSILEMTILNLKSKLRDQCLKNQKLKDDFESLSSDFEAKEQELKEILQKNLKIETEKNLISSVNAKLANAFEKFFDYNENAMDAYKNLTAQISSIDKKCEVNIKNIKNDYSKHESRVDKSVHNKQTFCQIF